MITISVVGETLTQWDVNRQVVVQGAPDGFRAHFWNDCTDRALVVPPNPGTVICHLPNILLQRAMPISVAIFAQGAGDGAEGKTEAAACFRVTEKLKPQDYDYTENIGYIDWTAKAQEVQAIMDDLHRRAESGEFNGQDGYSPTITVSPIEGGHRVTVTDRNGTKSVDVLDGSGTTIDLDPTLTDPTKAAQAKATGDEIRLAREAALGAQAAAQSAVAAAVSAAQAAKSAADAAEQARKTAAGKQDPLTPEQLDRIAGAVDAGYVRTQISAAIGTAETVADAILEVI